MPEFQGQHCYPCLAVIFLHGLAEKVSGLDTHGVVIVNFFWRGHIVNISQYN